MKQYSLVLGVQGKFIVFLYTHIKTDFIEKKTMTIRNEFF
jgi:hypothetical protein